MAENMEKIISRVKKLLALSSSPNQHEAEQASVMAFELMARYSIEMSAVEGSLDNEIKKEELISSGRLDSIIWDINQILDKYFYVSLVRYRDRYQKKSVLKMMGKQHRIEIAKHVFNFLYDAVDRAWQDYRKTLKTMDRQETMDRKYYFSRGFIKGVEAKLEESKINLQEQGLVIVRDADLDAFMKKNITTQTTKMTRRMDQHADGDRGYAKGKKTDIFSPVGAGAHFKSIAN